MKSIFDANRSHVWSDYKRAHMLIEDFRMLEFLGACSSVVYDDHPTKNTTTSKLPMTLPTLHWIYL